jgi:hypothetical protein
VAAELKRILIDTGGPFEDVINEAIRAALAERQQPAPTPYRLRPSSLGKLRVAGPLENALQLADELGDAALLSKGSDASRRQLLICYAVNRDSAVRFRSTRCHEPDR